MADIVGYAALLFKQLKGEKYLIILSDMRHSCMTLNLEHVKMINVKKTLTILAQSRQLPDLDGIQVAMLGVHTYGIRGDPAYYCSLELFWWAFFKQAKASLLSFETTRAWQLPAKE